MAPIQVLPASVAERIAAGEVIDRPAAGVKELLENAIDAGARAIRIDVRGGGLKLIRVSDDGCGIDPDEIELAVRRHATSKLRDIGDLERIQTLGFRGEALASLASVADLTLLSAMEGRPAVSCTFRAGQILERTTAARARGTTVTVHNLFSTMPARLKFMHGSRAEAAQIGAVVRRYALARPDLSLTLMLEGHTAFQTRGGELPEATAAVYGDVIASALLPIEPVEVAGARLRGLISGHGLSRSSRAHVSLFVNGRYVRCARLLAAIEDGYRRFLPRGGHAIAAVFIDVPPADLDVNIHPAKLDVRLRQEHEIGPAIREAVQRAYGRHPSIAVSGGQLAVAGSQQRLQGLPRRVAEQRTAWDWGEGVDVSAGETLPALRLVGQVNEALILAEAREGFYLIDQHRAHERILYEALLRPQSAQGQALIEPSILELPEEAAARLSERLPELQSLGIDCEPFGPARFLIRAAPAGEGLLPVSGMLPELLREAAIDGADWQDRFLASLACHAALRKGRALQPAEAQVLVRRLGATRAPAVCPHGSPAILHLSGTFLARQFGWG